MQSALSGPVALILAAVGLGAAGQICLKIGMDAQGAIDGLGPLLRSFLNPLVATGFGFYGFSSLLWLKVLKEAPLSFAYPMIATGYVIVVFLSWAILKEHVSLTRIAGLVLICAGVIVVSRS